MSTTLGEYKDAVISAGMDRVTDATAILDAINEARRDVADERRWSWLESFDNVTLTLAYDTPSLALDDIADLLYVDAVRIELGTEYYAITYLTPQDLRDKEHTDRTPDVPIHWTHASGQLRFWPSPNKAYTVAVDYIAAGGDLVIDDEEDTFIPTAFKSMVKWKAVELLCFRTRDFQASTAAETKYLAELRRKQAGEAITQRQTSQQVISTPKGY